MSIFDDIRKDAEAGTPGPWQWVPELSVMDCVGGQVIDSSAYENMWFCRYDENENAANARRMSRVPELEHIALATEDLAYRARDSFEETYARNRHLEGAKSHYEADIQALAAYWEAIS